MQEEMIFSGFGGQGALFAGMVLAYAGMDSGKNLTWIPSYGPEMRGGTAHVTVIIGDEEIGSPITRYPSAAMALNSPSLEKYEPLVKEGGVLVYNSSLISRVHQRSDIRYIPVPANEVATNLGNVKMANMVALGALVAVTKVLPLEAVAQALRDHLPESKRDLVEPNLEALRRGAELGTSVVP
ncbi:MAG: 2-oxoacid:acceptor oxidoreductase family protein [Anaerolineales bacterium]|nr:MAG: 2-oxoacid:acceptor oxidoreductase family protein [Anaerolineales bacterium]